MTQGERVAGIIVLIVGLIALGAGAPLTGTAQSTLILLGIVVGILGLLLAFRGTGRREAVPSPDRSGTSLSHPRHDRMRAWADADEGTRQMMITERMEGFLKESEDRRIEGMKMMLSSALELPDEKYGRICGTQAKVLMGFSESDQMKLMKSHWAALRGLPKPKEDKEMRHLQRVMTGMPEEKRKMMATLMAEMGLR